MSRFWNNRTKKIIPYIPGEQPKDRQFIKLNTNENPYPPSPKVIEAIQKAANDRLQLYPDPACTKLREAVALRYGVKPEQVFAGNGSDEILAFAYAAFFGSDAESQPILFPDITYSFYPVYASLWNIMYRTVPLREDFSINCKDYKTICGGVIFHNPNTPTGMTIPLADILQLAEYLEKQDKVFILDEAYIAFATANVGDTINSATINATTISGIAINGTGSAVSYINEHPNLLTVHTLSKLASLAGLRVGFAIGDEKLIEGLCRIRDSFNSYTLDQLALAGAAAAVSDTDYYAEIGRRVIVTRNRVTETLHGLGCTVLPSAANFIFMKFPNIGGANFCAALRERGILVRYFNKERIADFVRVSIGTDAEMDVFIDACRKIGSGE
jgi:histidinol-phosphate aminotransferase